MRFIHFRFGKDYLDYLDATDGDAQRELINDQRKDTCVHMHSTKWFNLQFPEGRRTALCHVLALVRWHGDTGSMGEDQQSSNDDDDDFMDTRE